MKKGGLCVTAYGQRCVLKLAKLTNCKIIKNFTKNFYNSYYDGVQETLMNRRGMVAGPEL